MADEIMWEVMLHGATLRADGSKLASSLVDNLGILCGPMGSGIQSQIMLTSSVMPPFVGFSLPYFSPLFLLPEITFPSKQLALKSLLQAVLLGGMQPMYWNLIVS